MSEDWRTVPLSEVLNLDVEQSFVEPQGTYQIVGVLNRGRGILHRGALPGTATSYARLNRVRGDRVVYSRLKAFEGAVTVAPPGVDCYASPEFPTFSCRESLLPAYMRLVTTLPSFWVTLEGLSKGMGGRRERVSPADFLTAAINLPPLHVQRRIVDLMAHLDNHLGNLKAERESARSDLVRERDHLLSQGTIVDAGDAFDILLGRQRSPGRADGPSMTLYLRAANIKNGKLDLSDVKSMDFDVNERLRYSVNLGDVLVTEGSGSANAVGAAARWQGELAGPVCFQNTLLRFRARPGVSTPSFTYQWCRWAYESGAFRETATGTNILHIGATRAVKMPVRLPSVLEQDEACAILEDRELLLRDLDTEIRALGVVRSALLGDLLLGTLSIDQSYDSLLPEVS